MKSLVGTPKRHSAGMHMTPGFDELIRHLLHRAAELQAIESRQVDAIIDPATGGAILLPEAQQALREDQARNLSLVKLSSDWQWENDKEYRFVTWEGTTTARSAFEDKTIIG